MNHLVPQPAASFALPWNPRPKSQRPNAVPIDVLDAALSAPAEIAANLNRKNHMRRWSVVAPFVLTAACASVGGARNAAPDAGKERWFDTSAVELLDVARNVLVSTKYKIREQKQESDTTWYIIATRGSKYGCLSDLVWSRCPRYEVVRIRIVGSEPDSTHVWVHRKEEVVTVGRSESILTQIGHELCLRRLRLPSTTPLCVQRRLGAALPNKRLELPGAAK